MIKSTDAEVRGLIASLGGSGPAHRDAAVARLRIIGVRALGRLLTAFGETRDRTLQVAILRVFEGMTDARVLDAAEASLPAGGDLAVAGTAVLRELVASAGEPLQTRALDLLLTAANTADEHRVRAAAAEALAAAAPEVSGALQSSVRGSSVEDGAWADALEGRLPDTPGSLAAALARHGTTAPLTALRRMIDLIRDRERSEGAALRADWIKLRGGLHQALALRASRVAVYDLRETFSDAAGPLPPAFLGAVRGVGDESCLEALAAAYARAARTDARWRHQLAEAIEVITRRERLTAKHAALKRARRRMAAADSRGELPASPQ